MVQFKLMKKLSEYLSENEIEPADFAKEIDVHVVTVKRYLKGDRIPDREVMPRIKVITGGVVTADSFY